MIAIVLGAIACVLVGFFVFVMAALYRRSLAIRRKRAMRRYLESGEVCAVPSTNLGTLSKYDQKRL